MVNQFDFFKNFGGGSSYDEVGEWDDRVDGQGNDQRCLDERFFDMELQHEDRRSRPESVGRTMAAAAGVDEGGGRFEGQVDDRRLDEKHDQSEKHLQLDDRRLDEPNDRLEEEKDAGHRLGQKMGSDDARGEKIRLKKLKKEKKEKHEQLRQP